MLYPQSGHTTDYQSGAGEGKFDVTLYLNERDFLVRMLYSDCY